MNLYNLTLTELTDLVTSWGESSYRAKQIWEWLYTHKVDNPGAMSNLPSALRERLAAETEIGVLKLVTEQHSKDRQTIKCLFRLADGQLIESVLMRYDDNRQIGNKKGALKIRNSWGTAWGQNGYGWLPYAYVEHGLAVDFWSLFKAGYIPTGVFK